MLNVEIYVPFMHDPEIAPLLCGLGQPVVVQATISPCDLRAFTEYPFARTLVSYFAHSLKPAFSIESREGYLDREIEPADIVAVHPHAQFVAMYRNS